MNADFYTICQHKAAHAMMRYHLGMPCTKLEAREDGGICHGSGEQISPSDNLRYILAGFAYEARELFIENIDFSKSTGQDFDEARAILEMFPKYKIVDGEVVTMSIEEGLAAEFRELEPILNYYETKIEMLAMRLMIKGELSASKVSAFMTKHVVNYWDHLASLPDQ